MKIYTKRGDGGETGLIGGHRVSKSTLVIETLGDLDELNACLGICLTHAEGSLVHSTLERLQRAIFDLGAEIAAPDDRKSDYWAQEVDVLTAHLEEWIDLQSERLPELKGFVLPGGTILAAHLHHARTVCRRMERGLVALSLESSVRPEILESANRLSDWLFCAARYANKESGVEDVYWHAEE